MSRLIDTPDRARAVGWIRDLLEQLGEGADAVLTEVLADRDVRGLRVVGWREYGGVDSDGRADAFYRRSSLCGVVGTLVRRGSRRDGAVQVWRWTITSVGHGSHRTNPVTGEHPTLEGADRALCLALRELGWSPVEVPTEESVRTAQERELPRDFEYVRVSDDRADALRYVVEGIEGGAEERNGDALSVDWAEGVLANPPGSREWQQQYQQQPAPEPFCLVPQPGGDGICTREPGHRGAHGCRGERWPDWIEWDGEATP